VFMLISVSRCSLPRVRRPPSIDPRSNGSASANACRSRRAFPRFDIAVSVSVCSSPCTRRRRSSTSRSIGSASSFLATIPSRSATSVRASSVAGSSAPSRRSRVSAAARASGIPASYSPSPRYRIESAYRSVAPTAGWSPNPASIAATDGFRIVRSIIAAAASVAFTRSNSAVIVATRPARSSAPTSAFSIALPYRSSTSFISAPPALVASTCPSIRSWKSDTACNSSARRDVSASAATASARCASATRRCPSATRACHANPTAPTTSAAATAPTDATTPLCRRTNLLSTYAPLGGAATTASPARYRCTSAASAPGDSYRRARFFSIARITIQSSSPRSVRPSFSGSVRRLAATLASVAAFCPSLVLGLGGSTSRSTRCNSPYAADRSSFPLKGVLPVSNSYISTPSEYTSVRVSMSRLPSACSGLMYSGVPINWRCSV